MNYYNDFDKYCCEWLRNLITAGELPPGDVDDRSITDVQPEDLAGYDQCHFFCGIGGWPLALRLAGAGDVAGIWTGSCPCQPYSSAGKGLGDVDPRNLWPQFFRLIRECRPERVFGEQVEAAIKHGWLDGISADLEAEGYAVGAVVLGAHSVGAPHIRQRLYWVADDKCYGRDRASVSEKERESVHMPSGRCWAGEVARRITVWVADAAVTRQAGTEDGRTSSGDAVDGTWGEQLERSGDACRMAYTKVPRGQSDTGTIHGVQGEARCDECEFATGGSEAHGLADAAVDGQRMRHARGVGRTERSEEGSQPESGIASKATRDGSATYGLDNTTGVRLTGCDGSSEPEQGIGSRCVAVYCRDNKVRRISSQSGDEPLAYGVPRKLGPELAGVAGMAKLARRNRVGRLRGYGNAICVETAVEFIKAYFEGEQ